MRIGIFGTGMVGQALASRLAEFGHDVMIGTRDVAATLARTKPDNYGNPGFGPWHAAHPKISVGTLPETGAHGEILVNATSGVAGLEVLKQAGADKLPGRVLIDVANPLDFSRGMPPSLSVCNTDSLGEQIQRAFPALKVVKALNTTNASVMANPSAVGGGDHTLFVCGNDAEAKAKVTELVRSFGWRDVVDAGDITAARGTEMLLPLWLRLFGAFKTPLFNFKIVR
jgi:8-hydroxy-5-deazaflavin:NADPH oxidoreductase